MKQTIAQELARREARVPGKFIYGILFKADIHLQGPSWGGQRPVRPDKQPRQQG